MVIRCSITQFHPRFPAISITYPLFAELKILPTHKRNADYALLLHRLITKKGNPPIIDSSLT